jgi:hypothetical protein
MVTVKQSGVTLEHSYDLPNDANAICDNSMRMTIGCLQLSFFSGSHRAHFLILVK